MRCRNEYFKNSFITYVVGEWNRLSTEIQISTSSKQFRKSLLSFIKSTCSSLFSIHHSVGVKLLFRLRFGFSHLCEQKFRHYFQNFPEYYQICGVLRDLVAFVQFKNREKHPWRSVNFSKA